MRKYRHASVVAYIAVGVWAAIALTFWIGLIYTTLHFIWKFW